MGHTNIELSIFAWVCIAVMLFTQGTWLFYDARKMQFHPWFWGILGLLTVPTPLVIYLVITRVVMKKRDG